MRLAMKAMLVICVLAGAGLLGLALFADLPPPSREISLPVEPR
jgi:hypothetical protein